MMHAYYTPIPNHKLRTLPVSDAIRDTITNPGEKVLCGGPLRSSKTQMIGTIVGFALDP
jgi:hypothetical protein